MVLIYANVQYKNWSNKVQKSYILNLLVKGSD